MSTIATARNAKVGFALSIVTAFMWGNVPIAVKEVIQALDAPTLVWYRFLAAVLILFPFLLAKKQLPLSTIRQSPKLLILLSIASLGIIGNFILFSAALVYTTPTIVQIVIQLSSVGLLFASVIVFKEHLSPIQLLGVIILIMGLGLFFNKNAIELFTSFNAYSKGVFLTALAAFSWVFFALAQKVLLRTLGPFQILFTINLLGVIYLLPFVNFSLIFSLSLLQFLLLFYCGLNTVLGYGALAAAMNRWEVSKVSSIITLTPLFTLGFSQLFATLWSSIFAYQDLNLLGYIGVFVVVFGAMFMVIGESLIKYLIKAKG